MEFQIDWVEYFMNSLRADSIASRYLFTPKDNLEFRLNYL